MIGVLYELGRALYKWAAAFAIIWSFVSVVLVATAGDYVSRWVPTTPFTSLAIISSVENVGDALRNAALTALSTALSIGAFVSMGYLSGQYYISQAFRSTAALFDIAVLSSIVQIIISASFSAASVLGPTAAAVIAAFGALLSSSIAVYMAYNIAGVPPPP